MGKTRLAFISLLLVMVALFTVPTGAQAKTLSRRVLGVLGEGQTIRLAAGAAGARFLLVAAQPLHEPVARGGPFVMNTKEEIMQAFDDYKHNQF